MKKFLSLALIILLLFTLIYPLNVFGAEELDVYDKADVLNKLNLLSGDNGSYLLDEPLSRSQAAAFITRLLGMEEYVLSNSDFYSSTKFIDVDINKWYAPYIGYCTSQGIIAGVDNLHYQPDENTTEKAFLKLLIVALGYDYGTDFTWANIYEKAYEIGLVEDSEYLTKTQDNTNYLRRDVVNAMYNALTIKNKKTKITMVQNLITENVITMEQAIDSGLINNEDSEVSVNQLLVVSDTGILLIFNRNVEDINVEDIKIYETNDFTKQLDISIQAQQPNTLAINTSKQTPYIDYTVEIKNVTAEGSSLSTTVITNFTGYKESEVDSEFFKIKKIESVNNTTINVYFTHPLNSSSENASYYEILEGNDVFAQGSSNTLTARYAKSPDNMVTLSLQGLVFKEGQQYILKVSGNLMSLYAVKLNEGNGDSFRFAVNNSSTNTSPANNNSNFNVTKLTVIDYRTLQLEFNREVHPTRAQQIFSYYITDAYGSPVQINRAVIGGSGSQSGKIIYISINGTFIKTHNYKIMINEIQDITRQYSIIEKEYTFSGAYPEQMYLQLQSVSVVNKNTISVYFDRPLDPVTATTREYYTITGITQTGYSAIPVKVLFEPQVDANRVVLYLPENKPLTSGHRYKLSVLSIMKDSLGNTAGANREYTFYGNGDISSKPYITDAVIISSDTIKVTTNTDIALNVSNISQTNFTLEYIDGGRLITKNPFVGYINSRTLVLKFDVLDFSKEYTLRFNSLTDYSELYTRTSADGQNSVKVRLGKD